MLIRFSWQTQLKRCYYTTNLLNKLSLFNKYFVKKVDLVTIKKAILCAQQYHGFQIRQSGELYYSHPLQVAYMVADYNFTTEALVTSILHDTIEDTNITKEIINQLFGIKIANNVEQLTRVKKYCKISSKQLINQLWVQNKTDLLLIKVFDRLHNMQTIQAKTPCDIKKILIETKKYFIPLANNLRLNTIALELQKLCNKSLNFIQSST